MADILFEVPIAAPSENIYRALTEREGLASWWTPDVSARPEVGSMAEFIFGGGPSGRFVVQMQVLELTPGQRVRWQVMQGIPEWIGTEIVWELTPTEAGTRLRFTQRNYPRTEGSFASAAYGWGWYLSSLQDYLETGAGRPGQMFRGRTSVVPTGSGSA